MLTLYSVTLVNHLLVLIVYCLGFFFLNIYSFTLYLLIDECKPFLFKIIIVKTHYHFAVSSILAVFFLVPLFLSCLPLLFDNLLLFKDLLYFLYLLCIFIYYRLFSLWLAGDLHKLSLSMPFYCKLMTT
jgi:hypothetical protein